MEEDKFAPIVRSNRVQMPPRRESIDGKAEFATVEELDARKREGKCIYDSRYNCYDSDPSNRCPHNRPQDCKYYREKTHD